MFIAKRLLASIILLVTISLSAVTESEIVERIGKYRRPGCVFVDNYIARTKNLTGVRKIDGVSNRWDRAYDALAFFRYQVELSPEDRALILANLQEDLDYLRNNKSKEHADNVVGAGIAAKLLPDNFE